MRAPLILAAGLAAALLTTPASGHEYKLGDLEIGHPYALASGGKTAAGYFSVTNHGTLPDTLVAIRADVPRAEVHGTETDASGVTRMTPVKDLAIPPGGTVTLEPGGLHVMFMGLAAPLAAGGHLPATLVFQHAGEIAVDFHVEARDAGTSGGMSAMPGMTH
ncbi:MAG: copper chaperone PCu(A)C [Amaricoccus sp.]|uniref:copper chaperone PCu(A)C n=1 Tax=Amaricoccus sp. TaxID=1872485 RepID=UPI0039E59073